MPPYVSRAALLRTHLKTVSNFHRLAHNNYSTLPCFSLQGKTCVVTGASQGLGSQLLAAFVLSGANGAVIDLSTDSANKACGDLREEVKSAGLPEPRILGYECDASSQDGVLKTFNQIVQDFGKVDVMVTNAGITGGSPVEDYDFEEWKKMLDVNVNGTFLFAQIAAKHMIEKKIKGSIIMSAYNVSKAATAHLTKSMASELGEHGIRVNALSPGYIQTAKNEGEEMEELSKEWVKMIPLQRIAKPEEFRGAAVFMASDASSYMTGSDVVVDGGYTVW